MAVLFDSLYHFSVLVILKISHFKATYTFPNDKSIGHLSEYILIDLCITNFIDYFSHALPFFHVSSLLFSDIYV